MRAAIYARVSSTEQSTGVSLEMQQQRCTDWISSRGWSLIESYADVETGRHAQRKQLIQLRRRLSDFDALVVWRFDRASRSLADLCALMEQCAESSVVFASVTEGVDVSQPFGRATASILGTVAELESDNIGTRVAAAKQTLVKNGTIPWKLLFGYTRGANGKAVMDMAEAEVVRRVFRERGAGRKLADIAKGLNADAWLRRGVEWEARRVCSVLHDETYIGRYHRGRKVKRGREWVRTPRHEWVVETGLFPTIVSPGEWYLVHKPGLQGRRSPKPSLFRGLLICAECGETFHLRRRSEKATHSVAYRCTGRHERRGCTMPQIPEARLLNRFRTEVARCGREQECCFVEPVPREEAEHALTEARATLKRAQAGYLRGVFELEQVEEVDAELRAAQARLAQSSATLADEATSIAGAKLNKQALAMFRAGHVTEANALLRRTIARIELDSRELTLRIVLSAHVGDEASVG